MIDPQTPPPCPACGCTRIHSVMCEPPPDQTTLQASVEIQTGHQGMYDHPKNLITIQNCAQCGHDMTELRKRMASLKPGSFERAHAVLGGRR